MEAPRGTRKGVAGKRSKGRRLVAVAASVVLLLLGSYAASAAAAVPNPSAPAKPVQVAVVGDSLSTGFKTPGDTWTDQAQLLINSMGLKAQITNASENGAGYVQRGNSGDVFMDLVNRIVNSNDQVVVIFGSDNDEGQANVPAAIQATLARIKVLAPHATLIVVGPTSESDDPQGNLSGIRQGLETAADQLGAQYVDPVTLKWFQGADSQYLGPDLEHPNVAGEKYLARQMMTVLAPVIKAREARETAAAARTHTSHPAGNLPAAYSH